MLVILAYGLWLSPEFKEISAGVAIFLFGMLSLEEGFKAFTGGRLEGLLRRSTDRLWKALGFGVVTTTLMQSSSLVSVITISFLSAGLLGLAQGIGIIYGANLGTTTGAWLVAGLGLKVKIAEYAMPMLVFGVILLLQRSKTLRGGGYVLAGLGFIFLGIHYMKDGFEGFRSAIDLAQYAVPGIQGVLIYTLLGILATVVMQSSHATLVLTLTALAAGQITYLNALGLAIGANVGTTITAVLGAIGANVEGRRLAAAHVLFNVVTGIVAIVFIQPFMVAVEHLARWIHLPAGDYTLRLALFHTLFNLVGIALMLPFTERLVCWLERLFRVRRPAVVRARYLHEAALEVPDAALAALRKEVVHLFEQAFGILAHGLNLHRETIISNFDLDRLVEAPPRLGDYDVEAHYDLRLKQLYSDIIDFASRLRTTLPEKRADELYQLRNAARGIVEAVKDVKHMRGNLVHYTSHENPYIRAEYNRLRAMLAKVLRELHRLLLEEDADVTFLSLDRLKVEIREMEKEQDERLEQLIRARRITSLMATSLMNDAGYAFDAAKALINSGQVLYRAEDEAEDEAERALQLEKDEIDRLAGRGGTP
ncbi:MAG: Na/Pi cotransporter family protein [Gammaproteobacteria bacterium]|nr:MAG: Na/Pi cotransporter family protein [Gammaproteobacteria bacterium]